MEYQRIAAAGFVPLSSTDAFWVSWNGAGDRSRGFVFGTLLGPEATGPWLVFFGGVLSGVPAGGCGVWDVCFWFPGCADHACCVCGVCGTGLLFENYIVDASIFYKKQFPRI